jgi:hypothetical protein
VGINASNKFMPTQYSQQWFFDIQRELPLDTLLTVGYSGNGTRKLIGGLPYSTPYDIAPSPIPLASRRLWPFYNSVTVQEPFGNLGYHGLVTRIEKRFSKGLTFSLNYTWSHAIDNIDEVGNSDTAGNNLKPWDRSLDRGNSLTDIRHAFGFVGTYELPIGKGKRYMGNANRLADLVLGGWQMSGIFTRATGQPYTVTTTGGITNAGGADRPNRIRNGTLSSEERSIDRWFDVGAFPVQPNYTYGNSGRAIQTGPGLTNLDVLLAKTFRITERFRLQFRAESFNVSNTPAFANPAAIINAAGVGRITSAGEPRRVQFGLKLLF